VSLPFVGIDSQVFGALVLRHLTGTQQQIGAALFIAAVSHLNQTYSGQVDWEEVGA
jgi:hypothetical protein